MTQQYTPYFGDDEEEEAIIASVVKDLDECECNQCYPLMPYDPSISHKEV